MTVPVLFLKAHVAGYTRRTGTYVRPHERGGQALGRVLAAAHQADAAIHGTPAGDLVESFVGHQHDSHRRETPDFGIWSQRRMESAFGPHPSYEAEVTREALERAFAPVRETLRREFGPTIRLYRAQAPVPDGAEPRAVLSWTADREVAEDFAGLRNLPKPATPEEIADAVARYDRLGFVKFRGKLYQRTENGFYDIYQLFRGGGRDHLTDGDDLAADLASDNAYRQETLQERVAKARPILAADVPVEDVVWITNRANQREFIVRNRGAAAAGPTMVKALPHPARPVRPTEAQKEAGNYAMERMTFQGLPITIENPRGSIRSGRDRGGHEWSVSMAHHYGYIRGTVGSDGDHYDVYVGPNAEAEHAYIVTTMAPPTFTKEDEQKAMLGFNSEEDARAAYLAHYDNPAFFGRMQTMPMAEFKAKVLVTAEGDGLVKAMVHAHERRGPGGRVIFVKPYSTRAPAADQPDLFSYTPPTAPAPKGMTIATDDVDRAIPGAISAAEAMRQRLMPGHVIQLRVTDEPRGPAGYITSPHRDIRYGEDNTVLPAGKPEPDMVVHINRSDASGNVRRPAELAHTLLHEFGHAFQFTRFHQAPDDVKRAIEAQWQAETHGPAARSMDEPPPRRSVLGKYDTADVGMIRRWVSSGVADKFLNGGPDSVRDSNLRERSPYFRVFEEWFAEKFAVWMTLQVAESPINRFFDAARRELAATWRKALALLGMKSAQHGSAIERFMDDAWREGAPMMGKAILFLKATIRGGAMGDLFAEKVTVQGHTHGSTFVAPYQATRHKAPEVSPEHADIATAIGAWHLTRQRAPKVETHADRLEAWRKKVHPRMALSAEERQKIVEAMDARRTRLNAKVRAMAEKEKAQPPPELAAAPPFPRTNGEMRDHMLAADDDTYLRTLAELAHRRLDAGGRFHIATYGRVTNFMHPDHKTALEYRGGQIMVRQGSKWVALGKVGQAIDSLASSLGVPTTYDRAKHATEKAEAEDPGGSKRRAAMEEHARALAPHFDAHDKARDAWASSGTVEAERALDAAQRVVQDEGAKRGLDRYGVGEARDIHDERPKPKPGIPPDVARRISDMVKKLHEHHEDLTDARKLDGGLADPHYEQEWRTGRGTHAQMLTDKIDVFRGVAEGKGLKAESDRIISEAGGLPDMKATGPIRPQVKTNTAEEADPALVRANALKAEYEVNVERLANNQQARNGFMAKLRAAAAKTEDGTTAATMIDVLATRAGLEWQHAPLRFKQPGDEPKKMVLMPKPDLAKTEARHRRDIEKLTTGMLPPQGSPEDVARLQKVAKLTAKHSEAKAALDAARAAAPPPKATPNPVQRGPSADALARSAEHTRLNRAQREAYVAYQNAPPGDTAALEAWQEASHALASFNGGRG